MKKHPQKKAIHSLLRGFSKFTFTERKERLVKLGVIQEQDISILTTESSLSIRLAENLIENVIGTFPLPLGVAVNFLIDNKEYIIPMAIEETSVIASASKTAKWIRENGEITTSTLGKCGMGQIQFPKVQNYTEFSHKINSQKDKIINKVNKKIIPSLVQRGGGLKDITVRSIERTDHHTMGVVEIFIDTCDAMGANIINQVCEYLKPSIENLTGEICGLCILSNLADTKLTQANVVIHDIDKELGELISEASLFAQLDPYRAATNNKGVMNAIDGVLIATGNDWRAVEAGIHAYAGVKGPYTSITKWQVKGNNLHGEIKAPILVGVVGGITKAHPIAKICLEKILNINNADELARVVAAVGLVQNLGAIRALVTEGIIAGHMKLHVSNLAIAAGATRKELPVVKKMLQKFLLKNSRVSERDAKEIIAELRNKK